jgi:SAM-dependent methyltransferase
MRTFETQRQAWRRIPVDDLGYHDAAELARLPDGQLRLLVSGFEQRRYGGWRNAGGLWRAEMGLDDVHGRRVLDYGCGAGIEALQYARGGNWVSIADINPGSLELAERVLALEGYRPENAWLVSPEPPFIPARPGSFDLVAMNGVLHHIEDPVPVVRKAARWLAPGGELRVMVYTDRGWRAATGTEPPDDVTGHPRREAFVRWGDEVGDWADWYDAARLRARFGRWFSVERFTYIAGEPMTGTYAVARLRKKP